jgi:hypothetical protein
MRPFLRTSAAIVGTLLLCVGCDDDGVSPLRSGGLQVTLAMTGEIVDGDGAAVTVDGGVALPLFAGSGVDFPDLLPGSHVVELVELAGHCTVVGQNPRAVTILSGQTASTTFDVSCGTPGQMSLADLIVDVGTYPETQPSESVDLGEWADTTFADGSRWSCRTEKYSVIDAPPEYATFDPNAEVIYPASMLQGATLGDATPEPVVVRRAGGTVVINLLNGSPGVFRTVDEVKQSTIVQAINDIIADNREDIPARLVYRSSFVESEEQLALELGVNVKTLTAKVKSQLSFSREKKYNRMMVEFVQSFYTVSFDLPLSLGDLFHSSVTAGDLQPYVGPGNPPTYISSVTYGRRFVLLIESTSSKTEIEAKVRASYDAVTAKANWEAVSDNDYVDTLEEVKIKVFALGGDQSLAAANFNATPETLNDFLVDGANIRTGVPLSYVVRNVVDNSVVNVKVATDYDVKNCRIVPTERFYSGFDDGTEEWTSDANGAGSGSLPRWRPQDECGGNSGGCVSLRDNTPSSMRYQAPSVWTDQVDWSAFHKGRLRFLAKTSGGNDWVSARPMIYIRGAAGLLTFQAPEDYWKNTINDEWGEVEIELKSGPQKFFWGINGEGDAQWQLDGVDASEDDILNVLSEVVGFFIRAEFRAGTDTMWLDEVEVVAQDEPLVGGSFPGGG